MGYTYELTQYYKIEIEDDYSWPCKQDINRTITVYPSDILTINSEENGICNVLCHTGLCCFGILIPKCELKEYTDAIQLGINI